MDKKVAVALIRKRVEEFQALSRTSRSVLDLKAWAIQTYVLMNGPESEVPYTDSANRSYQFLCGFAGETNEEGFFHALGAAAKINLQLEAHLHALESGPSAPSSPGKKTEAPK